MQRYCRQLSLPEIDLVKQEKLQNSNIVMVGAGGLGAAALPYLAGAGVGNITIIDHDIVDISNLHRQVIYRTDETGEFKAQCAKKYLMALNPNLQVNAITDKLTKDNAPDIFGDYRFDIILDGSDNFETKSLLNEISITTKTPLISASLNQFSGQVAIFEGYRIDKPCYRCLFPKFPANTRNCNEAGILGTAAGIVALSQAHISLCYLLGIGEIKTGKFLNIDMKTMRNTVLSLHKDRNCTHCNQTYNKDIAPPKNEETNMVDMIRIEALNDRDTVIIDVRQPEELISDPLKNPLITCDPINIPLPELASRLNELPKAKRLAFLCAGNIRSVKAANYLNAQGVENICILDKFSI